MKAQAFLDQILQILYTIKEDKEKLQKTLQFMEENFSEETEEIKLPEKYEVAVNLMAESIDAGFVCYLNIDTAEVEEVPKLMIDDPEEFELMTGESYENFDLKHTEWGNCLCIEP